MIGDLVHILLDVVHFLLLGGRPAIESLQMSVLTHTLIILATLKASVSSSLESVSLLPFPLPKRPCFLLLNLGVPQNIGVRAGVPGFWTYVSFFKKPKILLKLSQLLGPLGRGPVLRGTESACRGYLGGYIEISFFQLFTSKFRGPSKYRGPCQRAGVFGVDIYENLF